MKVFAVSKDSERANQRKIEQLPLAGRRRQPAASVRLYWFAGQLK
jgi:hypothetical protein